MLISAGYFGRLEGMGRAKRADDGGLIYHVLNRAIARMTIFEKDGDYEAFERVLQEAVDRTRTRLLASCVMPNHWHLILWPQHDGELSRFVGWLTPTHTQRLALPPAFAGQRSPLPGPLQVISSAGR